MVNLNNFRHWCYKVLPLVYDDSLSYYEVLCKVVDYINDLIEQDKIILNEVDELKKELEIVQKWIADFNTEVLQEMIKKYIATMIFVEIDDSGYITYYIPSTWSDITFNTTNLDIEVEDYDEYGRLVLSY